jgi:hypothetical protein
MLVTEKDALASKWCPMVRLRWEKRTFSFNRSNPGPRDRFRNMIYKRFFPSVHDMMRGHYFRCQGSGCMMWRWETPAAPANAQQRKGYCGLAGTPFMFGRIDGPPAS